MRSLNEIMAYFGGALAAGAPYLLDPGNCLGVENGVSYLALSRSVFTGALASCFRKDDVSTLQRSAWGRATFTFSKSSINVLPAWVVVAKTIKAK